MVISGSMVTGFGVAAVITGMVGIGPGLVWAEAGKRAIGNMAPGAITGTGAIGVNCQRELCIYRSLRHPAAGFLF